MDFDVGSLTIIYSIVVGSRQYPRETNKTRANEALCN